MDDVAAALGLAKGTLYRYVPTREGLLLALAANEYADWFDDLDAFLADRSWRSTDRLVAHIVDSLLARPRFLRLVTVLPSVLERNVPVDLAREFKSGVLVRSDRAAAAIAARLGTRPDRAVQFLVHLQAGVIGLAHHAHPAPVIRDVLAEAEFAPMRIDLRAELTHLAAALVAATR